MDAPIAPVHTNLHRIVRQGIRYRGGVAAEYRCPVCGELHPLDRRDWDEARQRYAGRFCDPALPIRANSPAEKVRRQRLRREAARVAA